MKTRFMSLMSEIAAILLSGFMFDLFHKNLQQFIYATVIGIIFAYIYIRTGRLRYSIILHMLINFMGSVVVGGIFKLAGLGEYVQAYMNALSTGDFSAVLKFANDNMDALMILGAFEMVIGAVILTGIILWIVAFAKKSFHLGKRFRTAVINPGILIFILIYTGVIIYHLFFG